MTRFWWGFLAGGSIIPFVIVIALWAILYLYPMVARKMVRKLSGRWHIALNPPRGIKRTRVPPPLKDIQGSDDGVTWDGAQTTGVSDETS